MARHLPLGLLLLAAALGAFAWWGLFTSGGNRQFDEMDGLIPFFAGVAAAVLLLAAALSWWWGRR